MSRYIGRRRLIRFAPPAVLYARAAALERRSVELSLERHSRRIRNLGDQLARQVEEIADEQARRAA